MVVQKLAEAAVDTGRDGLGEARRTGHQEDLEEGRHIGPVEVHEVVLHIVREEVLEVRRTRRIVAVGQEEVLVARCSHLLGDRRNAGLEEVRIHRPVAVDHSLVDEL